MKNLQINEYLPILLVFVLLALVGCSEKFQPSKTEQPTVSPTLQIKIIPSETATTIMTPIPGPTQTQTVTPTQFPTITSTPRATLEPTQLFETIQKFLNQGDNCSSPCILGIVPGQSNFNEALDIFNWLRNPLSKETYSDGKSYYDTVINYKEKSLSIYFAITEENGVVKSIKTGLELPHYKIVPVLRVWQAFSADTLLQKYGIPSQVVFGLSFPAEEGFSQNTAWYTMVLYFEKYDLAVEYFNGWTVEDNLIKVCPLSDQYDNVSIYLGKNDNDLPDPGISLEQATSLTLDQFTALLKQKSKPACFDISKQAFFPLK